MTELKGPNANFVPKVLKHGGDVKMNDAKKTNFESVVLEDYAGKQSKPERNPGADRQSREVHAEKPASKGARPGMEQPTMGSEEIGKQESLNKDPRAFTYSREGHAADNGSASEGQ